MYPEAPELILESESCNYYDDGRASSMVYSRFRPSEQTSLYTTRHYRAHKFELLRQGFLSETYAAAATVCESCNACVPLRINVDRVSPSSRQLKMMARGDSILDMLHAKAEPYEELYPLYLKYMSARHPTSKMLTYDHETVMHILTARTDMLFFVERENSNTKAFAIIDRHDDDAALDMVVYDPDFHPKSISLGRYVWLKAQEWAKNENIATLYLGPVNDSIKLRYKSERNPESLETYENGEWKKFDSAVHVTGPDYISSMVGLGILTPD